MDALKLNFPHFEKTNSNSLSSASPEGNFLNERDALF